MRKKGKDMVKLSLEASNPPPLTTAQQSQLEALRRKTDGEIDYSDLPALDDAFWKAASRPLSSGKQQITLRLDEDVLDFFRQTGRRYQTRINAVLRAYVEAHKIPG